MITIGEFEAKTHLSNLLDRVAAGEEVLITRRGRAIARVVAVGQPEASRAAVAVEKLKALRKGTTLGGLGWKTLRDAGRR